MDEQLQRIDQLQQLHNAIVSKSGNAIITASSNGIISSFNKAAEHLLGYSADEVIGHQTPLIFHLDQELAQRARQFSSELGLPVATGFETLVIRSLHNLPNRYEWTLVHKNGNLLQVLITVTSLDSKSQTAGFLAILVDISHQKKLQKSLEQSEKRFKNLFDNSPDPTWIIHRHMFVDCNLAAVQRLGFPSKEALLQTHPSELSPRYQPDGESSFSKAERMMQIALNQGVHRFEWLHRCFDNSTFWAEVTLSTLQQDNETQLFCQWRDISRRKSAENNLRENETRLRAIVENMTDWIWEVDLDGNFTYANGRIEEILGYTREELLQMSVFDLMPPGEAARVKQEFDKIVAKQRAFRDLININQHKNGSIKRILTNGVPIFDSNGRLGGYRGTDSDVTQTVELREQLIRLNHSLEKKVQQRTRELASAKQLAEQANAEKSRFLASISHELRTPLHAVISFANLGLKRTEDDKLERYLQNIRTSGIRLVTLINDLLDIAKLEAGKMSFMPAEQDIITLIITAIEEVESLLEDKSISIDIVNNQPIDCLLDQKLMRQVIINLLSNALKFSPAYSVISIDVKTETSDKGEATLAIIITDQGVGIPEDKLESVFEKFTQATGQRFRGNDGTGLGLPICREIINLHDGEIWAQSPPAEGQSGTAILIRLPLKHEPAN